MLSPHTFLCVLARHISMPLPRAFSHLFILLWEVFPDASLETWLSAERVSASGSLPFPSLPTDCHIMFTGVGSVSSSGQGWYIIHLYIFLLLTHSRWRAFVCVGGKGDE